MVKLCKIDYCKTPRTRIEILKFIKQPETAGTVLFVWIVISEIMVDRL